MLIFGCWSPNATKFKKKQRLPIDAHKYHKFRKHCGSAVPFIGNIANFGGYGGLSPTLLH